MTVATRICRDDRARRARLRASELNGLDYLEVNEADRHRLSVFFISKLGSLRDELTAANFVVTGGVRVQDLVVTGVEVCDQADPEVDDCAVVTVDRIGDFSTYTLCVVESEDGRPTSTPHHAFDPVYSSLVVDFQVDCPSPLDCAPPEVCPEPWSPPPAIDYLAKDYASFRRLLLDRLDLLIPGWHEEHEPDLLVTLVELLAYEGDRLSYLQDAVATEAYLQTARRRISVRRHARLVDYLLHEGCNARAWVYVETSEDTEWIAREDISFITSYQGAPAVGTVLSEQDLVHVAASAYEVFEPIPTELPPPRSSAASSELARSVLERNDRVAEFVRSQLQPTVRDQLDAWGGEGAPPADLDRMLLDELTRLAHDQALHLVPAFDGYTASPEALRLLRHPLRGRDVVELSWLLLHAAFEHELAPPAGIRFVVAHNRIVVHTWGERDCCLPRGTTAATLVDSGLLLVPGDWLLLEEVRDPATGLAEDADPTHRHVVRLTRVTPTTDPVLEVDLLEVEWAAEDALPFPLCLSAQGPAPDCEWLDEISIARGNLVLVDHGRHRLDELDAVEVDAILEPCDCCRPEEELLPAPYTPVLAAPDLTFAEPVAPGASATAAVRRDPRLAVPQVRLEQIGLAPPRLDDPDPLQRYRNPVPLTAFDPEDLVSPGPLAVRLKDASAHDAQRADPLAAYLIGLLDETTRGLLAAYDPADEPSPELADGLLRMLDLALDDDQLAEDDRFPQDSLDEPSQALARDLPLPLDLRRLLRRWLLEQALDGALAPSRREVNIWLPRYDLLASTGDDRHFVVEMTDDRLAALRFGDDDLGRRPEAVSRFRARYRVGNGPAGNVGAEAITFLVHAGGLLEGLTLRPRNPLPASGGTSPQTLDDARRLAPASIRRELVRAVVADDYAALAARDFAAHLQGADAELVWTGSWYEAYVGLDPLGSESVPPGLLADVQRRLERYRRIGHGLRVAPARYVPLDIAVSVCVDPTHQRGHVLQALQDAFAAGCRADGRPGFFDPDNMRFRSNVDVSEIVTVVQQVEGVVWAAVTKLERTGEGSAGEVDAGTLAVSPLEIPRVDSRFGFPEYGSITFDLAGGR